MIKCSFMVLDNFKNTQIFCINTKNIQIFVKGLFRHPRGGFYGNCDCLYHDSETCSRFRNVNDF